MSRSRMIPPPMWLEQRERWRVMQERTTGLEAQGPWREQEEADREFEASIESYDPEIRAALRQHRADVSREALKLLAFRF